MLSWILLFIVLLESILLLKGVFRKYDGRIEVDETRDSWTIAITENPDKINKKRYLKIKVMIK
jgi:hypothetical protein